ncbi:hypothetical protein AB1398_06910, partial [Hydrogenibacillus schlegelii]
MSYDEFVKKSRFGCSDRYTAFREPLGPLLRRIQGGAAEHHGRAPKLHKPRRALRLRLERLRGVLLEKVAAVAYEEAARLLYEISRLERDLGEARAEFGHS